MEQNQKEIQPPSQMWFPEPHQVFFGVKNPNYLNSLWIGLTCIPLALPILAWVLIVAPVLRGTWGIALMLLRALGFGLAGNAIGVPVPKPEITFTIK